MASESAKIRALWMVGILFWLFPILPNKRCLSSAEPGNNSTRPGRAAQSSSWTLRQIYALTLKNSERLAISQEAIHQSQAQRARILGEALPAFSFRYQNLYQDTSGVDTGGSLGTFTQGRIPEAAVKARLPIFTGYREISALKSGSSLIRQRIAERERLQQIILLEAASAFYGVLQAQENLKTTESILRLTRERLVELKERARLGRSRPSEVLETESEMASTESEQVEAGRLVSQARSLVSYLCGLSVEGSFQEEAPAVPKPALSLQHYLASLEERPDVSARREAFRYAQQAVHVARSGHFPRIDLTGNYYLERIGFREPINWDITLGMEVPLWSWGATQASVRETQSQARSARKELERARRLAQWELKNAYEERQASLKRLSLQEKALSLARRNYEIQAKEYRLGLVNNLDVLAAMNRLRQAERLRNILKLKSKLDEIALQISSGFNPFP